MPIFAHFPAAMPQLLATLLCAVALVHAQLPVIDRPATPGPGTGLGASVNVADVDSIYTKILQYNYQYMSLSELEAIEIRLDDRVQWEFHLGVGAYDPTMMYKVGFAGVKLNLSGGKMAEARRLQARLRKLRSLMEFSGSKIFARPEMQGRLQRIETEIDSYNRSFWWKRLGVAFWVPFYGQYQVEQSRSLDGTDLTGSGSYNDLKIADSNYTASRTTTTQVTSSGALYQDFRKAACALTYDLGDLATLSLGGNLDRKLFLGVSLDVSTPISEYANTFRTDLRGMRSLGNLGTGN